MISLSRYLTRMTVMMAIRIMPTMVETPVSSVRNVPDMFRMIDVPTTLDRKT